MGHLKFGGKVGRGSGGKNAANLYGMLAIKRDPYGCAIPWISQKADVCVCSLDFFPLFLVLFLSLLPLPLQCCYSSYTCVIEGAGRELQSSKLSVCQVRAQNNSTVNQFGRGRGGVRANPKINHVWVLFSSAVAEGSSQWGWNSAVFWGFPLFSPFLHRVLWDEPPGCADTVPFLSVSLVPIWGHQGILVSTGVVCLGPDQHLVGYFPSK